MSAQSWLVEHYPITAEAIVQETEGIPENLRMVTLTRHSLRKWLGLTKEALEKHGVKMFAQPQLITYKGEYLLSVDSSSCSLCVAYLGSIPRVGTVRQCPLCPLYLSRGGVSCDNASTDDYEVMSPWHAYAVRGNPAPMIRQLEQTIFWLESRAKSTEVS